MQDDRLKMSNVMFTGKCHRQDVTSGPVTVELAVEDINEFDDT